MPNSHLARGIRHAILVLVAVLAAQVAQAQGAAAPAIPVGTAAVENRAITGAMTVIGRAQAIERVDLRARVDGYLDEVTFTEGDDVTAGDLLYRIDPRQFQADVDAAKGTLDERRAEKALADLQFARAQELMEKNTGTVVDRDKARAEADRTQGAVLVAEAQLSTASNNFDDTDIRAPISGRIGRTAVTKGALVGPSSGVLATMVRDDPMYVLFPVSTREFQRRDPSGGRIDPATIVVKLRFPDGSFYADEGRIDFIDVAVNESTDTVQARTTVPNSDRVLIDGQLLTVVLEAGTPVEQPVVPQAALIADQGGVYVFVVEDGKAVVRRIKPGGVDGADVVVAEGLAAGDQVIVEGIERIRPGAAVLATPVAAQLGSN